MSGIESAFCRSAPWRLFARKVVLPWALDGHRLAGEVLEIGGGSGAMAYEVARRYPDIQLTVTDVDPGMAEFARARLSAHEHVSVHVADVTRLPFDDASFDVVTTYLMLHHVIEWPAALHEIERVLRPGGVVLGYDLTDTALARLIHRLDGSPHRIIAPGELEDGLVEVGLVSVGVRASGAQHVMRLQATKPGDPRRPGPQR